MDQSVFRFIWRYSKRDQLLIVGLVLLSLPFYFLSLDLPKTIVNNAIQGEGFAVGGTRTAFEIGLPAGWFGDGYTIFSGVELERVSFLVWMSLAFLTLVIVNGLFKLVINTAKGRLGERMLRRLRFMLFDRILRFPFSHFRKVKAPELATMVKDEVEPLGGFIGDAYVQPVFLGGQTLTALIFIIAQNFWLGMLAGGIALIQALLIPRLRRPILVLGRERQLTARDLAGRIGEAVDGIEQIYVNDVGRFERADMAARLGRIFGIRFELYQKKFSVKFINNMLSQLTPFLFYLIGGYLAIKGQLDVGQLIAVIVAYKDLPGPMKELIDWDQRRQDTQIKYEQVVKQFDPEGLADTGLGAASDISFDGPVVLSNLTLSEEGGAPMVEGVSVTMHLDESLAMMGPGAGRVMEAMARLRRPTGGDIRFGKARLATMPNVVFGRHLAYIGQSVYLRGPTLFDTLAYALKSAPVAGTALSPVEAKEARRSGNPLDDPAADWIDYARAGVQDMDSLRLAMLEALAVVEMEDDVYSWGLREPVRAEGGMEDSILRARRAVAERLMQEGLFDLVERFDVERVNANATIAENLLFGAAVDESFEQRQLPKNDTVLAALREAEAFDALVEAGRTIATTLIEIFEDLSPDNPLMERYSFVDAAGMPKIRDILERPRLSDTNREVLLGLALGYIDVRHRLGVLNESLKAKIVAARGVLHRMIGVEAKASIAFYDPETATPGVPLIDDILFGRVANDIARARERVEAVMFEVLVSEGLLTVVRIAGLNHEIGPGGRRLTASQRQRIGLARAMLRRPDVLLLNEPMVVVDEALGERIFDRLLSLRAGLATYAALARPQYADLFGRRIWFEDGRLKSDETDGMAPREITPAEIGLDTEVAALERVPLFAGLEPSKLKLIALSSERMIFTAGEALFRQGDSADHAYVIIAGAADILVEGPEGETRIATVETNQFVGEVALLSAQSRSATVRATRDLTALAITKDTFFQMIEDFPQISIEMMRDLGKRLLDTNDKLAEARIRETDGT